MSVDTKDILDRHSAMRDERQKEEPQWREVAALIRPDEKDIGTDNNRNRQYDDIFDSTPLYALDDFASGLFSQATNPAQPWFSLGLQDKDLMKYGPVKNWLYDMSGITGATFAPALSTFYARAPAWFADLGCFGLGNFYTEQPQGMEGFVDLAIPMSESYVEFDRQGRLSRFHRAWNPTGAQLKQQFGDKTPASVVETRRYCCIHSVFANPELKPGAVGLRGKLMSSVYCSPDLKDFRVDSGYYEMPFHSVPWNLRSGRTYPTGPGHPARADALSLNEMERAHIVAGQWQAEPMTLVHDEGVLTVDDIEPNGMLYGTISENGKPLVQSFSRAGDIKLTMAQSEQRRQAIRTAFKFSLQSIAARPQMTAQEFLGWKQETLESFGANLSKIHIFGLAPMIARRVKCLQRAGQTPPPPPELAGQRIEINFESPLAKALQAAMGRAAQMWVTSLLQVAEAKQDVLDKVNFDAYADVTHEAFGPPPSMLNDDKTVAQIRAARAAQLQQQMQLENAAKGVSIAAEAAHAMQASTLAGGRPQAGKPA